MGIQSLAVEVRKAGILLAAVAGEIKNRALLKIKEALRQEQSAIINANEQDLVDAEKNNLKAPLLKRLKFDQNKINEVCEGIQSLIQSDDPVGKTISALELDSGLELFKVSRPIGVIGVIFESRPDALVQIASLCLKSGNAVLLKGGSEAFHTNQILAKIISNTGIDAGLPKGWLGLLETREDVSEMLKQEKYIDLIIPRGSNEFVRYIMDNTVIPVLGHADGICHLFIDKDADPKMAVELSIDSKCQYVAVCNALETILVHKNVASDMLPDLQKAFEAMNVKILGCGKTRSFINVESASEEDWKTEYLDFIVSIKVVDSMEQASNHINQYGSGHTDVIVTRDRKRALYFMDHVDTADAFWNCSTRFSDGFRFGLGAEVGVSTSKIHARGPVGLEGLMSSQWRLIGNGHKVTSYSGKNARPFTHKILNKDF